MKIIAFGDSLTVGYQYPDPPAPYASFLALLLPAETAMAVAGISGETTSDMLRRFDRDILENRPDRVIILGGTNDLGWGLSADAILKNLTLMYRQSLAAKIAPVACAVPSLLGADDFIPPRVALNRKIEQEANALQIPFVDFFKATCDPAGRLLEKYASDGLHLNARGYEKMARAVYETLFKK